MKKKKEKMESLETGEYVEKPKKKKKWKIVLLIVLLSVFLLFLAAVFAVGFYANHLLDQLAMYDPANDVTISHSEAEDFLLDDPEAVIIDPDSTEEMDDLSDVTFPTEPPTEPAQQEGHGEHIVNILLIGQDRRPGQGRQRSDSMILATFNKSRNTLTLTSFMRDAYVQITGYQPNKLNAAYAFGGMSLLNETLRVNYGIHVDGNVEVDFNSFTQIIDMLGGVDINMTTAEVNYLAKWDLQVGMNRLTGEQALAYSQIRYIDSDYRRTERQRKVLLSLLNRYKSLSVTQMLSILEDVLPYITTNMDKSEIVGYAVELTPMLASAQFENMRIPADGTFRAGIARVRPGLAAWFQYDIDFAANRELMQSVFEP